MHQIRNLVVDPKLQIDTGAGRPELRQEGYDQAPDDQLLAGEDDPALGSLVAASDLALELADAVVKLGGLRDDVPTGLGQCQPSGAPVEQTCSELELEGSKLSPHRALVDLKGPGRAGEGPCP